VFDERKINRLIAVVGLFSVLVLVVGQSLVLSAPTIEKPGTEVQAWLSDHRTQSLTAGYLLGLGFAINLVFLAGVRDRLRKAEGGTGLVSNAGFAGAVSLVTLLLVAFAFAAEAAYRADSASADTTRTLNDLTFITLSFSDLATAVAIGAYSLVMIRTGAFSVWLGWLGVLTAVVHVVAAAAFANSGFFSPQGVGIYVAPPLYYAWTLLACILLLRARAEAV
jgi:hypothetical protein